MLQVIKRNNITREDFNVDKIYSAIVKAMHVSGQLNKRMAICIAADIEKELLAQDIQENPEGITEVPISQIENMVFSKLIQNGLEYTAKRYEAYRAVQEYKRYENPLDKAMDGIINATNEEEIRENSNKNAHTAGVQRDLLAGQYSRDWTKRKAMPADILEAHEEAIIHFHDSDYFYQREHNCSLVNAKDQLDNGTVINETMIETPKSFQTACTVLTQISQQFSSGQYGGQTWSVSHLAPYLRISRDKIRKAKREEWEGNGFTFTEEQLEAATLVNLKKELASGIQTIQYQVITMNGSNGQAPFLSVFMYLNEDPEYIEETAMIIEEMLRQRIKGVKNRKGVYITPAFPKLLYVTDENNITPDSKYFYLTQLAAQCISKRMVPDCISAKIMKENYEGNVFPCMGCRSFLSPWKDPKTGEYKFYGRFNKGVVTINLADAGLSAHGSLEDFWEILDQRLELCHRALDLRYERLKGTPVSVSPIHFRDGGIARLGEDDTIDSLLEGGYSSISLGYAGLYECVLALIGESHTTERGEELALEIMNYMKQKTVEWNKEKNLGYSLYGTPIENTTYKFAKGIQKRFGIIPGITDRNYVTNSYHVFVKEEIDPFTKLKFEAQFQKISSGGAISYIESGDMSRNTDAIITIMQYMYENIQYAEINGKFDYCHKCGYEGEILIDEHNHWYCPVCGNRDQSKMNVARRTCGYIGSQFWGEGRTEEIKNRFVHLTTHDANLEDKGEEQEC